MTEQLDSIFKVIQSLFDLVIGFFSDLAKVAELLANTALQVPQYLTVFFPGDICLVLVVGISVVIIYKIAGR